MPISTADIIWRKSAHMSDTPALNGGRMSPTAATHNLRNDVFPDVRQAERLAGSVRWRKLHLHFAPPDGSQALDVRVVPWRPTPAADTVAMYPGSHTDTESTFTAALPGRAYGVATLASGLSVGATALTVSLEPGSPTIFTAGDVVYLTTKDSPNDVAGEEWYTTLAAAAAPSGGTQALTLGAPASVSWPTGARIASVIAAGDVLPRLDAPPIVTSAGGTIDAGKLMLYPRGTVWDDWTLSFTSATSFAVSGALTGSLGSATIGYHNAVHAALGSSYFVLDAGFFGGSWAAGDTVVFRTIPASVPLWLRRAVPAGAPSWADNAWEMMVDLETA